MSKQIQAEHAAADENICAQHWGMIPRAKNTAEEQALLNAP